MSLINKRGVRKTILSLANSKYANMLPDTVTDSNGRAWDYTRANKAMGKKQFTQVSQQLLTDIDTHVRVYIESYLTKNPQSGKTVK